MNWGFICSIVISAALMTAIIVSMAWWMFGL